MSCDSIPQGTKALQEPVTQKAMSAKGEENEENAPAADLEVFWNEPIDQDPENPMNWKNGRKWMIISIVSFITFLT